MSLSPHSSPSDSARVGIGLILSTAWASYRRRFGLHAGFGALWLGGYFIVVCTTSCCAIVPMAMVVGASGASGAAESDGVSVAFLAALYGLLLAVMVVAMALHQNVTFAFTRADLNDQAMPLREAARHGFDRLLPQSLLAGLRMLVDLVVFAIFLGLPFAALLAMSEDSLPSDAGAMLSSLGPKLAILGVAYVLAVVVVIGTRAFTGLGPALVVAESLGPIEAISRSSALLSGHRLAFVGAKFGVWLGFVVGYLALFGLMFAAMGVSMDGSNVPSSPPGPLLMMPVMMAIYLFALLVYAFDHVCEAALYSRLAGPAYSAETVAGVFR